MTQEDKIKQGIRQDRMEMGSMFMQVFGALVTIACLINLFIQKDLEVKVGCGAGMAVAFTAFVGGLLLSQLNSIIKNQIGD